MTDDTIEIITPPEKSPWVAIVAGIQWHPNRGQEPNAFHRLMQRLILGIEWKKGQ